MGERAIDDAVNLVRCVSTRDQRFLPGGGAAEIEVAYKLAEWGRTVSGLEQYAAVKFAECFEVVPRILAKNAGVLDHYDTKRWAIQLAVEAAMTVLRVDHIIVAKQ